MKKISVRIYSMTAAFAIALLMFALGAMPNVKAAADDRIVAYIEVPQDWADTYVWAWNDNGEAAFAAWPGEAAQPDPANEGWYYIYLPVWANNIIVSANDSTVQTTDMKLDGKNVWVSVKSAEASDISYEALTTGEAPAYVEKMTVHAKVPADWADVCLWAWQDPEGTNAFAAWPGEPMADGGDGWVSLSVPAWINSVIINANSGGVQTADIKELEAKEMWITVADDLTAEVAYENPDLAVPMITVHAQVPEDWSAPHLWAWLDPDGTNAYATWPGEPFTLNGDWYEIEVPGFVNSIIVNANDGAVQTGDSKGLEVGKDLWIVVTDPETYEVTYEAPAEPAPAEPAPAEPAPAESQTEEKVLEVEVPDLTIDTGSLETPQLEEEGSGREIVDIILWVILGGVAIVAVIKLIKKKKDKK
jgi:hypothetical protein